jgi:hypothetical protein
MNAFQAIRTNARNNRKAIISFLENHYLIREHGKAKIRPVKSICIFCSSDQNITKEHILPRWAFERHPNRTFKTVINGLSHKYNQTTLPACKNCNTHLLSKIENRVLEIYSNQNLPNQFFEDDELSDIIRWIQILDYKFQVFSLLTRFKAVAAQGTIPFLSDYSLSVLDPAIEYSPAKAIRNLRRSLDRITVRSKNKNINSLVVFKTSNPDISFFHKSNDFLFLELPQHQIAIIYFYELIFLDVFTARDHAMNLIKNHYNQ